MKFYQEVGDGCISTYKSISTSGGQRGGGGGWVNRGEGLRYANCQLQSRPGDAE